MFLFGKLLAGFFRTMTVARLYFIFAAIFIGPASGPLISYFSAEDMTAFQMALIVFLTSTLMLGFIAAAPSLENWLVRIIQPLSLEIVVIRQDPDTNSHGNPEWRQIGSILIRNTGTQTVKHIAVNITKVIPAAKIVRVVPGLVPMSNETLLPLPQPLHFHGDIRHIDLGPNQHERIDVVSYTQSQRHEVRLEGTKQLFWVGDQAHDLLIEATGEAANVGGSSSLLVRVSLDSGSFQFS